MQTKLFAVCVILMLALSVGRDNALAFQSERPKDPPSQPDNIIGYRYDKDWWELGDSIDNIDLRGFRPQEFTESGVEIYMDDERPLLFGKATQKNDVVLVFKDQKLAAVMIRFPGDDGSNFEPMKKYYIGGLNKCTTTEDEENLTSWVDKDGDSLTLESQPYWLGCPTIGPDTVILYLRRHILEPDPARGLPQWFITYWRGGEFES